MNDMPRLRYATTTTTTGVYCTALSIAINALTCQTGAELDGALKALHGRHVVLLILVQNAPEKRKIEREKGEKVKAKVSALMGDLCSG